jgi:hypothetical protein
VPTANDRDLAPKNHYVEWSAGRQAPPDTTPPTDEFAARSAPPVPLCASPEMSLPIPLTISTTECSSKARPDCDASIANWCSVSGRVVTGAAHARRWKERRHSQSPPLASAVVGVGEQGTSPSQACHHLDSLEWPIYGAVVALQWVPAPRHCIANAMRRSRSALDAVPSGLRAGEGSPPPPGQGRPLSKASAYPFARLHRIGATSVSRPQHPTRRVERWPSNSAPLIRAVRRPADPACAPSLTPSSR